MWTYVLEGLLVNIHYTEFIKTCKHGGNGEVVLTT